MVVFILSLLGLLVAVFCFLASAFLQKPKKADSGDSLHAFYRNALRQIDADIKEGRLDAQSGVQTRREIAQRFRTASKSASSAPSMSSAPALRVFIHVAVFLSIGAGGLYFFIGASGLEDLPQSQRYAAADARLKSRTSQAQSEARLPHHVATPKGQEGALLQALRAKVEKQKDAVGYRLLAEAEAEYGNYREAHQNWEAYLGAKPAPNGEDYAQHALYLRFAAGGYISPEAERAARLALERAPQNPVAQDIMGALYLQVGRPDRAFIIWKKLLDGAPQFSPTKIAHLKEQLSFAASRAGIRYDAGL